MRKISICIFLILVLLGVRNLFANYNLLMTRANVEEGELQSYCGYSLVYPILSNWENYSWIEKRNYQAFFQNMLAAYRFNSFVSDDFLFYISPEFINRVEDVKAISKQLLRFKKKLRENGWEKEVKGGRSPFSFIIYVIPINLSSYIIPMDGKLLSDSYEGMPVVIINGNKLNELVNEPCMTAHAYAHSFVKGTRGGAGYWLEESVSAWIETLMGQKCDIQDTFYEYRILHPEIQLGVYDSRIAIADAKFISLLDGKKEQIIRRFILSYSGETDVIKALSEFLIQETERDISDYYEEYAISNFYETLSRNKLADKGVNYFPYDIKLTLNGLSSYYASFEGNNIVGGLRFTFDTNDKYNAWIFSGVYDSSISFYRIENVLERRQDYVFPISAGKKLYLLLINNRRENANISVDVDEIVGYPCRLDVFKLNAIDQGVELTWLTSKEIDTQGWIVYKKEENEKYYRKLNNYIIPAAGNSNDIIRYIYVDKNISKKKRYDYYLELITKNGFRVSFPPISVKLE